MQALLITSLLSGCAANEVVVFPDFNQVCYSVDSAIKIPDGFAIVKHEDAYKIEKVTFSDDQIVIGYNHFFLTGAGHYSEDEMDYSLDAKISGYDFRIYRNEIATLPDYKYLKGNVADVIDEIKEVSCRTR